jgi:Ca2+-binding EF-hand superfamily protein
MTVARNWVALGTLAMVAVATANAQGPGGGLPGMGGPPPSRGSTDPAGDPLRQSAQVWDANHDGVLTCEEWKQYVTRTFNAADANRDGFLDAKEFSTLKQSSPVLRQADLGYFDDNRDGRLSRAEFIDKTNPLFARYDRNGDCRITADELRGGGAGTGGGPRARPTLGPGGIGGKVDF